MNTLANPLPPMTERLDYEQFRRQLAGLLDPDRSKPGVAEKVEIRDLSYRFCSILASLYGVSEDRKDLWPHITKAVATALAKVTDADLDRFATLCLESVQADPAQMAACDPLFQVLSQFAAHEAVPEWRHAFLQYIRSHLMAIVVHSRDRWKRVIAKEATL